MGDSIAHYAILSTVGAGTLGPVYRARDTRVGRTVAIRVLTTGMDDPAQRARAIDLIQPFTALTHPHVATLFDVGEQRGSVYLVYEFVPGDRLNALIAGQPLNVRRALDLAAQMADALADAHALGLVHGSLSTCSVIVTPKGHAKIVDFGLVAGLPSEASTIAGDRHAAARRETRIDALGPARLAYSAPEQLLGQAVDPRADLFALGAILHEMTSGAHAFSGRTAADVLESVVRSCPPMPSALNPDLPRGVDGIVAKALAKKADDRYQAAALMAADIRAAATVAHSRVTPAESAPSRARRSPWRMVVLGALLLAAVALGVWRWQEPLRQAWQTLFGAQPQPLLAVVPFEVVAADAPRPYFGPGFAEDLAGRLGGIPGITVLGRSTINASAGMSPKAVADRVGAAVAVSGTLVPADEDWTTLKVDVRLTNQRDGRVAWSRSYASAARDLVALQARVTLDVAAWLRIPVRINLESGRAALRLVNPSSYDKYFQARDAMAGRDASRAAVLFEAAAAEDPSLIEAQAGLAEALYTMAVFEGREHFGDVQPRARRAAEAAFAADPDAAAVRLAMGLTAPTPVEALAQIKHAVEIDASYSKAYLALAEALRPFDAGRANGFAQRAASLDPAQPLVFYQLAADSLSSGALDGALAALVRGQAVAPALPWWDAIRERVALARRPAPPLAGAQDTRSVGDFPPGIILHAATLGASGRINDAAALLGSLSRLHPGSCEARAMMAAIHVLGGRQAEGARIARALAAKAESAPDGSGWSRCAAMAAAGMNDSARAAAALSRTASSERELRAWSLVNAVLDAEAGLRQAVFPWSNVSGSADVAEAMKRVDTARAKVRAEAAKIVAGM